MQIFIPYADVAKIMKCLDLDWKRLGKQRVEAKQMINAILGRTEKLTWAHHPIGKMWAPYVEFLKQYFNECVSEWLYRGYVNNMELEAVDQAKVVYPSWWGDEELHSSHRGNLIRKDKDFYEKYGWTEKPRNGYLWIYEGKRVLVDNDARAAAREERKKKRESEKSLKSEKKKGRRITKKRKVSEIESKIEKETSEKVVQNTKLDYQVVTRSRKTIIVID